MEEIVFDSEKKNITVTFRYETAVYLYHAALFSQLLAKPDPQDILAVEAMMAEAKQKIEAASDAWDEVEPNPIQGCTVCNTLEGEEPYCALHEPKTKE